MTTDILTLGMAALYKKISSDNRDQIIDRAISIMRFHGEAVTGSSAYYSGRMGQIYVLMAAKHGHLASAFEEMQFIKNSLTSSNLQV